MFTLSGADLIRDIYAYCSELAERHVFGTAEVKPGNVIKLVLRLFLMDGFGAMRRKRVFSITVDWATTALP